MLDRDEKLIAVEEADPVELRTEFLQRVEVCMALRALHFRPFYQANVRPWQGLYPPRDITGIVGRAVIVEDDRIKTEKRMKQQPFGYVTLLVSCDTDEADFHGEPTRNEEARAGRQRNLPGVCLQLAPS